MDELLKQFWPDLIDRLHGPLTFRLILQPLSAALIACRAGLRDARAGRRGALLGGRGDLVHEPLGVLPPVGPGKWQPLLGPLV